MSAPYYADDLVTLYHGDCREITHWLDADVLVTDPPYGIRWRTNQMSSARAEFVEIEGDASTELRDQILSMWGQRPALVFGTWKAPRPADVRNRLIWYKASNLPAMRTQPWYAADEEIYQLGTGFQGRSTQNVLVTHDARHGAFGEVARLGHPTPKPVGLLERLVAKCPEGVVADPFAGVGSTLLAARNLGRKSIGVELEERYCETAAKRLSQIALPLGENP